MPRFNKSVISWFRLDTTPPWALLLLIFLVLGSAPLSFSQGGSIYGQVIQPSPPVGTGGPAAFPTVRVCPGTAIGTPCSPLSLLFSDPALTQPISNPTSGDQYGNFSVWLAPGPAIVQIIPVSGITYSYLVMSVAGTISSITITMPSSIFSTTGCTITSTGTCAVSLISQSANTVFAAPSGASGIPIFRKLSPNDFAAVGPNSVFGNCTGAGAIPSFCSLTAAMIPTTLNGTAFTGNVGVTGTLSANGAVSFFSTLQVAAATQVGGTLNVTGNTTINGNLNALGTVTFGTLNVPGNATIGGGETVGGTLNVAGAIGGLSLTAPTGSDLLLTAGNGASSPARGRDVIITAGNAIGIAQGGLISLNVGTGFFAQTHGLITNTGFGTYEGIPTQGNGIPVEYAQVDIAGLAANIPVTPIYTVPNTPPAITQYRGSCYIVETQAATTSSTLPSCTFTWIEADTPGTNTVSKTVTATNSTNLPAAFDQGQVIMNAKSTFNISYSTAGYASLGGTPMNYVIHIRLEAM